jgi:hypothetical protein
MVLFYPLLALQCLSKSCFLLLLHRKLGDTVLRLEFARPQFVISEAGS